MNEIFSEVVTIDKSPEEVLKKIGNPKLLGEFLVKDVSDTYLPKNIKDQIKYGETGVYLNVPGFNSQIELAEITSKHVKYCIDFPGLKEGVLYLQVIPSGEGCKMRLAGGYKFGISPAGLLLRSSVNEEKIIKVLNDIVNSISESFDKIRED